MSYMGDDETTLSGILLKKRKKECFFQGLREMIPNGKFKFPRKRGVSQEKEGTV